MGERLVDVKLRLSQAERDAVERLRGDRGLNICLRRAVQQWCVREHAIQEHHVLSLNGDAPPVLPPQLVTPPAATVTPITPSAQPSRAPAQPEPTEEPEERPTVVEAGDQPRTRRAPAPAELWGSGKPDQGA